jgi:hypothetical protein
MRELQNIYSGLKPTCNNELCEGCTILSQSKPDYAHMDYEKLNPSPVLFLSDSFKHRLGNLSPFSKKEKELLKELYPYPASFSASVKCPTVKEGDMTPNNMKLCRVHLDATIDKVQPKLVFVCGNLAMKMLIKKSGITTKRGKSYEHITTGGHSCVVVPIYHPYACIKEPRHRFLFQKDIQNAYEKYVLGKKTEGDFAYQTLMRVEDVEKLASNLQESDETLAIDIETTGLNFLKDNIQTIAFASKGNTWVIPLDHKDSPFRSGEPDYAKVWVLLRRILENPRSKKVFHNAKFDLKFLINYGIYTKNVWDTKIMHHFIDENVPKSLMDLVKVYFPSELEDL